MCSLRGHPGPGLRNSGMDLGNVTVHCGKQSECPRFSFSSIALSSVVSLVSDQVSF